MSKALGWARRYLPSEIAAVLLATIGASIARQTGGGMLLAAYAGTVCNYVGYYGVILFRTLRRKDGLESMRGLFFEFAPAEFLDILLVRPALLALFPLFVPSYSLGVFLGSIAASILFYVPVILSYEWQRRKG